jgi:hypothetical protein
MDRKHAFTHGSPTLAEGVASPFRFAPPSALKLPPRCTSLARRKFLLRFKPIASIHYLCGYTNATLRR